MRESGSNNGENTLISWHCIFAQYHEHVVWRHCHHPVYIVTIITLFACLNQNLAYTHEEELLSMFYVAYYLKKHDIEEEVSHLIKDCFIKGSVYTTISICAPFCSPDISKISNISQNAHDLNLFLNKMKEIINKIKLWSCCKHVF